MAEEEAEKEVPYYDDDGNFHYDGDNPWVEYEGHSRTLVEDKVERLDTLSNQILQALLEMDGTANTTEVTEAVGIENKDKVLYRFNRKLCEHELITLFQPESDTASPLAKVAQLTPMGEAVAKMVSERGSGPLSLPERVEQVENEMEQIKTGLAGQTDSASKTGSAEDLEEQVEALDQRFEKLFEQMKVISEYLNDRDDGGLSEFAGSDQSDQ